MTNLQVLNFANQNTLGATLLFASNNNPYVSPLSLCVSLCVFVSLCLSVSHSMFISHFHTARVLRRALHAAAVRPLAFAAHIVAVASFCSFWRHGLRCACCVFLPCVAYRPGIACGVVLVCCSCIDCVCVVLVSPGHRFPHDKHPRQRAALQVTFILFFCVLITFMLSIAVSARCFRLYTLSFFTVRFSPVSHSIFQFILAFLNILLSEC